MRERIRPYAEAVLATVRDVKELTQAYSLLSNISLVLGTEPRLGRSMDDPTIVSSVKSGFVLGVLSASAETLECKGPLAEKLANLLALMAERRIFSRLPELVAILQNALDEAEGRLRVKVETPVILSAESRKKIEGKIGARFLCREIVVEETLKPRLLGGCRIFVKGFCLDASLDGKLRRMKESVTGGKG